MTYYLAIDIGASSGRHLLGSVSDGILSLEEIYRFENGFEKSGTDLVWNLEKLFFHVKEGLKKCVTENKIPKTVAIDTWGVDYVLLDREKKPLLPAFSYRDPRGEKAAKEVAAFLPQDALYRKTGIQKQSFNTLYQLYCDKKSGKLEKAAHFLMIPEYLSFCLTGKMANEYTNGTTTNLMNAREKTWDEDLLEALGIPKNIFQSPSLPGTMLGAFSKEVAEELGFSAEVLLPPSHDTASAVAAIPLEEDSLYISSGTWSLVGTELVEPVLSREAQMANFTNEGGVDYRFRFLKNIMGTWLFQSIRRDLGKKYSYDEMMHMAEESDFRETFDPASPAFLAPDNMIEAVRSALGKPDLPLPHVLSSVYHSLALSYKKTIEEIESICKKEIRSIHIVGGGSRDGYLNRLTAQTTGRRVFTGLTEGTATGNIISQWMADEKKSLAEARNLVNSSFSIQEVLL